MKYITAGILTIIIIAGAIWLLTGNNQTNTQTSTTTSQSTNSQSPTYKQLKVGQKAPEFNLKTIDGQNLFLSGLGGKIIVLTSGAAWCPTCVIENKNFRPVHQEVKDKGVEFITVDIDPIDDVQAVRGFQETYAPWHNVHVSQAKDLIEDYGFWRFEITYIIDRQGIIRFADSQITETATLRQELDKLI